MQERRLVDEGLDSSLRAVISGAVARGVVAMAQAAEDGADRDYWLDVASRAVPDALERLEEAGTVRANAANGAVEATVEPVDETRQEKMDRLAALEAEVAQLRQELNE